MSDLPLNLSPDLADQLATALDREGKIGRALDLLGPVADRDVVVVGGGPAELARLASAGARVVAVDAIPGDGSRELADGSADAIVATWSGFRGVEPASIAEADRILRNGGRLLVVHDYGRDDVSRVRGDLPEYGAWSRRNGPFLTNGFRVRVLHCFWTFNTIDAARAFLGEAFGASGEALGAGLTRPRVSWNVALYHRTRGVVTTDATMSETSEAPGSTAPESSAGPSMSIGAP